MGSFEEDLEKAKAAYERKQKNLALSEKEIDLAKQYEKIVGKTDESLEVRGRRLTDELKKLRDQVDTLKELSELGVKVSGQYEADLEAQQKKHELDEISLKRKIKEQGVMDDILAAEYERLRVAKKRTDIEESAANEAEGVLKRFTGITKKPTTLPGKIAEDPTKWLSGTMGGMKGVISVSSIMTSTIDKVVEATVLMAIEQDAAVVQFNKATGASGEFDAQIRETNLNLRFAGVSAAEAGQAYGDLFTNVSDFTLMSKEEQMILSETTAVLNELGIASKDTAANIQLATKGLGMSVTQATELVRGLKTFGQELGISTAKMAADFNRMAPMITELGVAGPQAFKNLQREAKATGIDISRLYQITSKFDTFDQAAQSVGKLNAMLGGPFLNTMDMVMEEDPAERMRMLKESVDAAGLSFDTMSKFQRKALAEAMGLNDASELALVLRGREDLLPGATKSAEEIEALAAQTAEFNTVMDELKQIAMGFAIAMGPAVTGFKNFLQFVQPIAPYLIAIGGAIAAIASPIGWLGTAIGVIVSGLVALSTWWHTGFSPSGKNTFKAIKMSTQEITVATKDMNTVQQAGIAGTTEVNTKLLGGLSDTGIAGTTNATGMPAATAIASSNAAAMEASGRQAPIILELNGREFARETDTASDKSIGTKLVRQYA
jgi:hypothetical protein